MAQTSLFLTLTGGTPVFRIIDYLIEEKGVDHTKTDIAQGAGISRASLFQHWPVLEKHVIVRETRRFGKTKLYTLNGASPITRKLIDLERALISEAMAHENKRTRRKTTTLQHARASVSA